MSWLNVSVMSCQRKGERPGAGEGREQLLHRHVQRFRGSGFSAPHGGLHLFHQKSNCLTQLTLGPYVVDRHHKSRRCSRDTYPESYITQYTSIRRAKRVVVAERLRDVLRKGFENPQHPDHRGVMEMPRFRVERARGRNSLY